MSEQTQILEAFLDHPGWRLYQEHVEAEWGQCGIRYTSELEQALDLTDPVAAASQARQIVSARKAIMQLVNWPSEEIARLKRQEQKPEATLSRGGY